MSEVAWSKEYKLAPEDEYELMFGPTEIEIVSNPDFKKRAMEFNKEPVDHVYRQPASVPFEKPEFKFEKNSY